MRATLAAGLSLVAGLALTTECVGQADWRLRVPHVANNLETFRGMIFTARVELEMRRAGGPRAPVLMAVFDDPRLIGNDMWIREAFEVCRERVVKCADLLQLVNRSQPKNRGTPATTPRRDGPSSEPVAREGFSAETKDKLHRLALVAKAGARKVTVDEIAEDDAFRIYDERIKELYSAADAFLASERAGVQTRAHAARQVARASEAPQPLAALLALVREVTAWDVKTWSLPDEQRRAAQFSGASPRAQLVYYALRELRRLNLPGTLEGLKEMMNLYESERMLALNPGMSWVFGNRIQNPRWFGDEFSADIAEAIGDFGDRQVEREVLGGRCLWDMVSEAENAMVAKRLLAPTQMVTNGTH